MNFDMLAQRIGHKLKLLPPARLRGALSDDIWELAEVKKRDSITLKSLRSDQVLMLAPDHVHSFTSSAPNDSSFDGTLEVKVNVDVTPDAPTISIIPSGPARMARAVGEPLPSRLAALLDRITPEVLYLLKRGASGVQLMIGESNYQTLRQMADETEFERWAAMHSTGAVIMGGSGNRIGGHLHDSDESAGQRGFSLHFSDEFLRYVCKGAWLELKRPDEEVSRKFSASKFAPGDCAWISRFDVFERKGDGWTHYPGPVTGGAAYRQVQDGIGQVFVEFLMVKPGANSLT